ncbi:MAG: hypothetical protein JW822_04790 [Spirochaetales bacterium]|nr:hypothetical protein [Spirochaetales bacterium]
MRKLICLLCVLPILVFNCAMPTQGAGGSSGRITLVSEIKGEDMENLEKSLMERSLAAVEDAAAVVVSIENADSGELVYDTYELVLYNINGQFITESLTLNTGDYNLTQYLVIDDDQNVIFAAPLEGSNLAELVSDPLPIQFTVFNNVTTSVNVEVLPTEGSTAQDFGYAVYTFDVIYADLVYPQETIITTHKPGPDGILDTADDEIGGITVQTYRDFYSDNWKHFYDGPGADGVWLTDDDEIADWWWCRTDTYGSMQVGPGPDGLWFTTDDTISGWNDWSDPAIERSYGDPGADGEWFTADDVMRDYCLKEYDANGNEIKRVSYGDPGPDNIWETADDVITINWYGAYMTREYEGQYNHWDSWTRMVSYDSPGPDGIWFTADDEVRNWQVQEFGDGTKFFTRRETYNSPGMDDEWFTEDDEMSSYRTAENSY